METFSKFYVLLVISILFFPMQKLLAQQNSLGEKVEKNKVKSSQHDTLKVFRKFQTKTIPNKYIPSGNEEKDEKQINIQEKEYPIHQKQIITLPVNNEEIPLGFGLHRSYEDLTAAVGVIDIGSFSQSSTIINPANALYGQAAGLIVIENGGTPPTSPTFFIRGRGTFNSSDPLILIDGFEQPLSSISIAAIDKITILKDAATLALYGQRGANGVILVSTKRGTSKGLTVNASFEQAITLPTGIPDFCQR